jgi:hypothetical protein
VRVKEAPGEGGGGRWGLQGWGCPAHRGASVSEVPGLQEQAPGGRWDVDSSRPGHVWVGRSSPAWRSGPPGVGAGPEEAPGAPLSPTSAPAPPRPGRVRAYVPSWDRKLVPVCSARVFAPSGRCCLHPPEFALRVLGGHGNLPRQSKQACEPAGHAKLREGTGCERNTSLCQGCLPMTPAPAPAPHNCRRRGN